MNKSIKNKKVLYILRNSFLTVEEVEKYDDYEINVIYNNIRSGVVYGITE